jgi:hypothetical protein
MVAFVSRRTCTLLACALAFMATGLWPTPARLQAIGSPGDRVCVGESDPASARRDRRRSGIGGPLIARGRAGPCFRSHPGDAGLHPYDFGTIFTLVRQY